jgi:hypothetical protein
MAIDIVRTSAIYKSSKTVLVPSVVAAQATYDGAAALSRNGTSTYLPVNTSCWSLIPKLTNATVIQVCSTATDATQFRCGATCTFTVPSGTTKLQFELWGPGAGTGSGCCCGGSWGFGQSGSFTSIIIDAVPGCQYTVCAGCANCCYSQWASPGYGGPSYVQGYGLCGVCAVAGYSCIAVRYMEQQNNCGGGFGYVTHTDYSLPHLGCSHCTNSGGTTMAICNSGSDWCSSNMQPTSNLVTYGKAGKGGGTNSITGIPAYVIPGMWPAFCLPSTNPTAGFTIHPPIYGFENISQCCVSWTAGSSINGIARSAQCQDFLRIPSAGGAPVIQQGGTNSYQGDSGRFGMVRISYC